MAYTIKLRRATSERLESFNPKLFQGEPVFESDTGRFKIGDGASLWNDLPYFTAGGTVADLSAHINDPEPHPIYDDGPSLALLYENAKV